MCSRWKSAPRTDPLQRMSPESLLRGDSAAGPLIAGLAGVALALAFAPFGLWPFSVLAPALLFALLQGCTPRRAAWVGFCFGIGTFAAGTYWLYVSIHGFGKAPVWLALGLMAALVAVMALYSAALGYLAARWLPPRGAVRWAVGLPALWVLLEWLRGWVLSGFGWLSFGYAHTDTWLAGFAPLGGVYLISAIVLLMAGALVMLWQGTRRERLVAAVLLLVPWPVGAALDRIEWTKPVGSPVGVAIVQGAIPQDQKWLESNRETTLRRYRDLTLQVLGTPLVVWPEAAAPDLANNIVPYLRDLANAAQAQRSALLLGLIRAEPVNRGGSGAGPVTDLDELAYFNSLLAFGDEVTWYDKHHLVPFGEFFPVPKMVRRWLRLMSLPYSDFTQGAALQPPLQLAGLKLSASICYEDAYPATQRLTVLASTALVNVTNDAWFGRSTARYQHLQISRMRAIEARRFMVRAANDGVSAVIDPQGAVVAQAPEYQAAALRAQITPRSGATPYLQTGNIPILLLGLGGFLFSLWSGFRRRERIS
ncbi:MAG: apolipoprotein N-acyltransferase [Sinobacteraceae bacterium]|nr:apolipoprotein N-acyltransferase [Nevskiaceae bacterium]